MRNKLKSINNKYVRLIALIVVTVNASLQMMDLNALPFSSSQLVYGVSIVGIIIVGAWNFWKNNSFSDMAKQADRYLEGMKKDIKKQKKEFKKGDE